MKNFFFTKDEISEMESLEIKGGIHLGPDGIMAQSGCINNKAGCGANVDQNACVNNETGCGSIVQVGCSSPTVPHQNTTCATV